MAMGSGQPRSRQRLESLLTEAGFRRVTERPTRTPLLTRLLVAER
jgi:demethylspheroidene O-methyltransferase